MIDLLYYGWIQPLLNPSFNARHYKQSCIEPKYMLHQQANLKIYLLGTPKRSCGIPMGDEVLGMDFWDECYFAYLIYGTPGPDELEDALRQRYGLIDDAWIADFIVAFKACHKVERRKFNKWRIPVYMNGDDCVCIRLAEDICYCMTPDEEWNYVEFLREAHHTEDPFAYAVARIGRTAQEAQCPLTDEQCKEVAHIFCKMHGVDPLKAWPEFKRWSVLEGVVYCWIGMAAIFGGAWGLGWLLEQLAIWICYGLFGVKATTLFYGLGSIPLAILSIYPLFFWIGMCIGKTNGPTKKKRHR